eukprot:3554777-Amphidinium_carterae.1
MVFSRFSQTTKGDNAKRTQTINEQQTSTETQNKSQTSGDSFYTSGYRNDHKSDWSGLIA